MAKPPVAGPVISPPQSVVDPTLGAGLTVDQAPDPPAPGMQVDQFGGGQGLRFSWGTQQGRPGAAPNPFTFDLPGQLILGPARLTVNELIELLEQKLAAMKK